MKLLLCSAIGVVWNLHEVEQFAERHGIRPTRGDSMTFD
jgi:hypothetical protein